MSKLIFLWAYRGNKIRERACTMEL